jgi:hypothetical protein
MQTTYGQTKHSMRLKRCQASKSSLPLAAAKSTSSTHWTASGPAERDKSWGQTDGAKPVRARSLLNYLLRSRVLVRQTT